MNKKEVWNTTDYSVPTLGRIWYTRLTKITNTVQKPLTPKEFGQLNLLKGRLKDATVNVIQWVMRNWSNFTQECMKRKSLFSAPAHPHIGFLLAHHQIAVSMMAEVVPEQVATLIPKPEPSLREWLMSEED